MKTGIKCKLCSDRGWIKNKENKSIQLCNCIKDICKCGGVSPFFISEENSDSLKRCECFNYRQKIKKIREIFQHSGLPVNYYFKYREDFNIRNEAGAVIKELVGLNEFIINYIDKFNINNCNKGFILWSATKGNGKTFSASIILNELIFNYALRGRYLKLSSSYFGMIRKSYAQTEIKGLEQDIIKKYINYDVLLIDDFGTERGTEWETEKLYELIDGRCENKKLTFITTNTDLSNIDTLVQTDRIFSRIVEMCKVIKVTAPSYRLLFLDKEEV